MEGEDQNSKNLNKILDFVRSQKNGLEANTDIKEGTNNSFDYRDIAEGEDSQSLSNFFNLLSKALPIEQINSMLQQELERRRRALSTYQVKCNEAEYLLPKLTAQEESLNTKLKELSEDINVNNERLGQVTSILNGYAVEQDSLDIQIEHSRNNIIQLKKKLATCDKIESTVHTLCNNSSNNSSIPRQVKNMPCIDSFSVQHTESSLETQIPESSLTTDNISIISTASPAKSHTSEILHVPSAEHSLSDGEIVDDSDCGSISDSEIDDTDEI
ncbi:hypothetical protein LOD99_14719 [Oopsacas minuta]|uniref:Uncharacterized protein n=1 Tax=Oopsacas minuta TaxID=111878 RepID=A0AAV7KCV9_9METZ|nr:hypothetical protein LOD99_14719 [Oopsacas minuta]